MSNYHSLITWSADKTQISSIVFSFKDYVDKICRLQVYLIGDEYMEIYMRENTNHVNLDNQNSYT